jgi:hypothetical protein
VCDGDGSTGFGRMEKSRARLRMASTRLRRRTAAPVNSGDERQRTTSGTSERDGASLGRQEKGEGSAAFYREQEGEEKSSVLQWAQSYFNGHHKHQLQGG